MKLQAYSHDTVVHVTKTHEMEFFLKQVWTWMTPIKGLYYICLPVSVAKFFRAAFSQNTPGGLFL